jgi:hypothetical protein
LADHAEGNRAMCAKRNWRRRGLVVLLMAGSLAVGWLVLRLASGGAGSDAGSRAGDGALADASGSAALASAAPSASAAPAHAHSPVMYAQVVSELASVPGHLAGPLPRSLAEFSRFWRSEAGFRSRRVVEDLACAGHPRLLEELEHAALAAAQAGASAADLGESYGRLWAECRDQGACAWARRLLAAPDLDGLRALAYRALVPCTGDEVEALFAAATVPARALIERRFRATDPCRYSVALERAARLIISTGTLEDVRRAALVLGSVQDPRAAAALLQLQAETVDPERATAIGLALGRQTDPQARAAFRRACEQLPSEPLCILDVVGTVAEDAGDAGPAAVAELRRCVQDREQTYRERYDCFEQLARVERALATDMARADSSELLSASPDPWMRELATALVRFPTTQDLRHRLIALGLLDVASSPEPDHLTARSLLLAAGKVVGFEAETRRRPMGHDSELRRMATRAGPSLADVAFEEVPAEADAGPETYQIRAYVGGRRWSVRLHPVRDCYDLGTMVGLLNVLLRDLESGLRFVPLATNDEGAWAVFGPEPGLVEVINEGLLRPSSGEHTHLH